MLKWIILCASAIALGGCSQPQPTAPNAEVATVRPDTRDYGCNCGGIKGPPIDSPKRASDKLAAKKVVKPIYLKTKEGTSSLTQLRLTVDSTTIDTIRSTWRGNGN